MDIPPLKTSQGLLDIDADKANALNGYFSSVFTRENNESFHLSCHRYPDIPPIVSYTSGLRFKTVGNVSMTSTIHNKQCNQLQKQLLHKTSNSSTSYIQNVLKKRHNSQHIYTQIRPSKWIDPEDVLASRNT